MDSHLGIQNPARGIPAANARPGKNDLDARIVLPELQAVGICNLMQMDRLIEELFIVDVLGSRKEDRRDVF
jgi:hypothetical protein